MSAYSGSPMTLGSAAAAKVRLIICCRDCRHQVGCKWRAASHNDAVLTLRSLYVLVLFFRG
jgi:hypothetical protein